MVGYLGSQNQQEFSCWGAHSQIKNKLSSLKKTISVYLRFQEKLKPQKKLLRQWALKRWLNEIGQMIQLQKTLLFPEVAVLFNNYKNLLRR